MPTFSRVSHISFSVRDAEATARWWAALLDLTELDRVHGDGWRAILLLHPPSRTIMGASSTTEIRARPSIPPAPGSIHKQSRRARPNEWLHGSSRSA
jgi:glyoxylase I family protein